MSVNQDNRFDEDQGQEVDPAHNGDQPESQQGRFEDESTGAASASANEGSMQGLPQNVALVGYAERGAELFHTPDGRAYASVEVSGHKETYAVESTMFQNWLVLQFYRDQGKAPSSGALADALNTITAKCMFDGEEISVFVRVAERNGVVYVDLVNDDWETIEVTPSGWRVVGDPPIKFTRSKNSAPLPHPVAGGSVEELRRFLNVDDEHFKLVLGWLIGALNPQGPYPVLEVIGWQGTAKSTLTRLLVSLSDPAFVPLRALPTSERDLAIAARSTWVLAYDNASYIKPETSDAMCRLSTGGGFGTRKLYTDSDEIIFDAKRPQLVNGINPVVFRGDLQERSLQIVLYLIPPNERRQEREFWKEFEEVQPRILGALLDAVSCALGRRDQVRLEKAPRMADFATWVTAAEEALGWDSGTFMEAYESNLKDASEALLENDPVASAIKSLLDKCQGGEWSGTSEQLLEKLGWETTEEVMRTKAWPKAPNHLARHLNRIAPALKEADIEYLQHEEGREKRKIKTLRKIGPETSEGDGHGASEDRGETSEAAMKDVIIDDETAAVEDVDYSGKLTKLGWHRTEHIGAADSVSEDDPLDRDPVARKLRHTVPIYYGRRAESWEFEVDTPWIGTTEDVFKLKDKKLLEEVETYSAGWPATPAEMDVRLRQVLSLLVAKPRPFYDPDRAEWWCSRDLNWPRDPEKMCKEALLHAERWEHEETSEVLWALIAFKKGRRPPDEAIEQAVWRRVTGNDEEEDLMPSHKQFKF